MTADAPPPDELANERMTHDPSRFDRDPDALAWARAKVEELEARYRQMAANARGSRRAELAARFRWAAGEFRREPTGDGGCVIAAFDERRAALPPAPDGEGP